MSFLGMLRSTFPRSLNFSRLLISKSFVVGTRVPYPLACVYVPHSGQTPRSTLVMRRLGAC